MSNFIKFSSIILNTSKIKAIEMTNTKYIITLSTNTLDGFMLFTSGYFKSIDDKFEICKIQHPEDYKILTDWINKIN
jgi:hypothetical protein